MNVNCFVSINIICKNQEVNNIINENGVPIIFYWDGKSDINNDIVNNEKFTDIIKTYLLNPNTYDKSYLSLVYINDTTNQTFNTVKKIPIQTLYKLNDTYDFCLLYLKDIFIELYKLVLKEDYKIDDDPENIDIGKIIKEIYLKIKSSNNDKISDNVLTHYILSKLNENTSLSSENKNYLINKISEIVRES